MKIETKLCTWLGSDLQPDLVHEATRIARHIFAIGQGLGPQQPHRIEFKVQQAWGEAGIGGLNEIALASVIYEALRADKTRE
jgi:hypothetical protein